MSFKRSLCLLPMIILMGCNPAQEARYTPPEVSGLIGVRPYPNPNDVCQVIGENDLTRDFLDDSALLIGCPFTEEGAIKDRLGEGAQRLDQVGAWVLLSAPQ